MKILNPHSLIFKTIITYIFLTLLNISIFVIMVFENQLDLIAENAILNSQHKASMLKYRIDNVIKISEDLNPVIINKILKEASELKIDNIAIFSEGGNCFVNVVDNKIVEKKNADLKELRMINMAITKHGFEDKLFFQEVSKKEKKISLYIPFIYKNDMIGVASIILGMKDIDKQMAYLYKQCLIIGIVVTIVHILFAFLFTKMILIPLSKLNSATKFIAEGNLGYHVEIVRDDEIGQLASSFNEMSLKLKKMQEEAKGANPLTGLPGNISIAQYIDNCLMSGKIIAVLYCDLDNFKAYNDRYGFTRGDEAILYVRDCLVSTSKRKEFTNATVFIGHEGGDDFVVVIDYEYWEIFTKLFISAFDYNIRQFYSTADLNNGYIESINRKGEKQKFPIMSISVAVVSNKNRPFRRHAEMIAVAAEVKKYVKSIEGSAYAIDRRSGPVSPTQIIGTETET